jgi:hypothetical protein
MRLLGEIVEFEGMLCLRTAPNCYYPLEGNSGVASDFCESFNAPAPSDVGRRLYRMDAGHLAMESREQAAERKARKKV